MYATVVLRVEMHQKHIFNTFCDTHVCLLGKRKPRLAEHRKTRCKREPRLPEHRKNTIQTSAQIARPPQHVA